MWVQQTLDNHAAYVFGTILFESTVCIVLCCIFGIYSGFCSGEISYALIHVIYLRFLLRPVYFFFPPKIPYNYLIMGKKRKIKALWKNSLSMYSRLWLHLN